MPTREARGCTRRRDARGGRTGAQSKKDEEEPSEEEKTEFKLVLTEVTANAKVKVLKEVRVLKPGMKLLEVTFYYLLLLFLLLYNLHILLYNS